MANWTFITNHGAVLILISEASQITAREIANRVGITERSVRRIIDDLEASGYLQRHRDGRLNVYTVNHDAALRHDVTRDVMVGELLGVLQAADGGGDAAG